METSCRFSKFLLLLLAVACGWLIPLAAQPVLRMDVLGPAETEATWTSFKADYGENLIELALKNGFVRQSGMDAGWGFRGTNAQGEPVLLCVWTFALINTKEHKSGAMLWIRQGSRQYKAYLTFPEKMADLDQASEWFVTAKGKVLPAKNWHACFRSKLRDGTCHVECTTKLSHAYCYPTSFVESYTFLGKVYLFNLRTYLDCMAARCGAKAACLLSVALTCGYPT